MNEINKFPVKDLQNRYNVGRTALYTRFTTANITPEKNGTRSYISGEELEELDRLNSHIKTGGKLEEFKPILKQKNEMISDLAPALDNSLDKDTFTETLALIEAIAKHFSAPRDPLAELKALEYAAEHELLLPSSKVRELAGVKPHGQEFQRGSFFFSRCGKIGAQSAWRVKKLSLG